MVVLFIIWLVSTNDGPVVSALRSRALASPCHSRRGSVSAVQIDSEVCESMEEAAVLRDQLVLEHRGSSTAHRLNFPDQDPRSTPTVRPSLSPSPPHTRICGKAIPATNHTHAAVHLHPSGDDMRQTPRPVQAGGCHRAAQRCKGARVETRRDRRTRGCFYIAMCFYTCGAEHVVLAMGLGSEHRER